MGPGLWPPRPPPPPVAASSFAAHAASGRNFGGGIVKLNRVIAISVCALAPALSGLAAAKGLDTAPFWSAKTTAASFAQLQDQRLAHALAGVDKDEATRTKIKALRDSLVQISQEFERNIRSGKRSITAGSAAELDGLPADYIERHKPGPDGKITLTTDYPDAIPLFSYAK